MTTKEEIIEIIGHRPLTELEKKLVEEWQRTDKAFAHALNFQYQFVSALHQQERDLLKVYLNEIEAEYKKPKGRSISIKFGKWIAVAASLLVGVGIWWITFTPKNKDLFETHFRPYPNVVAPVTRNGSAANEMSIQNAFFEYEHGDYTKAAALFSRLASESEQPFAYFYEAISKMGMGNTKEALLILQRKSWPTEPFDMKTAAEWYTCLCLIAENREEEALPKLEQITKNHNSPFSREAAILIGQLKK